MVGHNRLHASVRALMEQTGTTNPFDAIRQRAQELVSKFYAAFHEEPPFDMECLASLQGLHLSSEAPKLSPDAEIAPDADGRIILRVNRDRPQTRRRFSIGHEVGHTLFPGYESKTHCRKPASRDWADPEDLIESLCDAAASEFLFPDPWFSERVTALQPSAVEIVALISDYRASPEATIRRLVDKFNKPIAALFLEWKLKPLEEREKKSNRGQLDMFPDDPRVEPERKLRIDYGIMNDRFKTSVCSHLPKHKSVPFEGPIYDAAAKQSPQDGEMFINLGTAERTFAVSAIPVFSSSGGLGPSGEAPVAALLRLT